MSYLILVCGLPGAGKTTLAKSLEHRSDAIRLSPDEWIEPLLSDKRDRAEMDRLRPAIEEIQWTLICRLLSTGASVIWEQGFWHKDERLKFRSQASLLGAKVVLHVLDLSVETLKKRISARNLDLPHGSFHVDPSEIDTWWSWFERPGDIELGLYDRYEIHKPD